MQYVRLPVFPGEDRLHTPRRLSTTFIEFMWPGVVRTVMTKRVQPLTHGQFEEGCMRIRDAANLCGISTRDGLINQKNRRIFRDSAEIR
jgi:hypothetical protein